MGYVYVATCKVNGKQYVGRLQHERAAMKRGGVGFHS